MAFKDMHGYFIEDLSEGMSAVYGKTVSDADIVMFAGISGDDNPVHLNEEFAARTRFGGRIAHGMLSAAFISTVLGTRLPGPGCIYISQTLKFKAPVKIGDTVNTHVTVKEIIMAKKRVRLETVCKVGDTVVTEGESMVLVSARSDYPDDY